MILRIFLTSLYALLWIYQAIIFISIILSWIPTAYESKIGSMILNVSNWYMRPFRGWLVIGFLDFTPIIGIVIYQYILGIVQQLIM